MASGLWPPRRRGLVVNHLRQLIKVARTYARIERFTLMKVKAKKCVIVLTATRATAEAKRVVRRWLRAAIPSWQNFAVESAGRYLGAVLGPAAGESRWTKTVANVEAKMRAIFESGAPPSVGTCLYASRALPCLGYLMQIFPLPAHLIQNERLWIHKILKWPMNALTSRAALNVQETGLIGFPSLQVAAEATATRAAAVTLSSWQHWMRRLLSVARERGPIVPALRGRWSPACWDTEPIAQFLAEHASLEAWRSRHGPDAAEVVRREIEPNDAGNICPKLQRRLTRALGPVFNPSDLAQLCARRLASNGIGAHPDAIVAAFAAVRRLPPDVAIATFATYANAWLTVRRMQEDVAPCRFGCHGASDTNDELAHLLVCQTLWGALAAAAPHTRSDSAERIGIFQTAVTRRTREGVARRLAAVFHAARAVRLEQEVGAPSVVEVLRAAAFKYEVARNCKFADLF